MAYVQAGDFARAQALIDATGLDIDISKFNSGEKTGKQAAKVGWWSAGEGVKIAQQTADATEKLANPGNGGGGGGDDRPSNDDGPSTQGILDRINEIENTVKKQGKGGK